MKRDLKFEDGIAQLEEIVKNLEEGTLPLDQCFEAYEHGIKLVKALEALLDEGEARIRKLTADGEAAFEAEEES
jgi:exodeoxyribonuclease VII small subunit